MVMTTMQCESPSKADLWAGYRAAFAEFARVLRRVQALASILDRDRSNLAAASLELERARLKYNRERDALARELLRS